MPWPVTSVDEKQHFCQNKETMSGKRKKLRFELAMDQRDSKSYSMLSTERAEKWNGFLRVSSYFAEEKKKNCGFELEKKLQSWTRKVTRWTLYPQGVMIKHHKYR